jgi:hypothetical protein
LRHFGGRAQHVIAKCSLAMSWPLTLRSLCQSLSIAPCAANRRGNPSQKLQAPAISCNEENSPWKREFYIASELHGPRACPTWGMETWGP